KGASLVLTGEHAELHTPDFIKLHNDGAQVEVTKDGIVRVNASSEIELHCGGCTVRLKDGKIEATAPGGIKIGVGQSVIELSPSDLKASAPKMNSTAMALHEIGGGLVKIN